MPKQPEQHPKNSLQKKPQALALAISMVLATTVSQAATFNVTEANDDGTGLVANSLSWAILQANTTPGPDLIELNTDVTITGVMKRLIDSDTTLQSDATRRTIDGNNQFRPLFIKSGQVVIQDLDIENGLAQGGGGNAAGAGMGGAIFVYDGTVEVAAVSLRNATAVGGGGCSATCRAGGGMFGTSAGYNGGGLFANADANQGGYGGYGNYQTNDPAFGQGGEGQSSYVQGERGGFGAGGAGGQYAGGGDGGFGGGGGYTYSYNYSGNYTGGFGGFGGGGGSSHDFIDYLGEPGFGGFLTRAAGFGGSVFIRSGSLAFSDVTMTGNSAHSSVASYQGDTSQGYGGALFVMHTLNNSNGNNHGMPSSLPTVTGCGVVFANNTADTDPDTANNNDDVFDLADRISPINGISISEPCGPSDHEIQITGNGHEINDGDVSPDITDGTALGQTSIGMNPLSQVFDINNLGNVTLQLTGSPIVRLMNNSSNQFTLTQQPSNHNVPGGSSESFEVTFTPSLVGTATATVFVESNDVDEGSYEFVVQAETLLHPPEIRVTGNGFEIQDGDTTPEANDFTLMGVAQESSEIITQTFIIANTGIGTLDLTGSPAVELQNNNGQFSVTAQPPFTVLNQGEAVSFDVAFAPTSLGTDTTTVVIQNNDPDEAPYEFLLEAEGVEQAPIIQMLGMGAEIPDGSGSTSFVDGTYFGSLPVATGLRQNSFTILNVGYAPLEIAGVLVDSTSGSFFISQQPTDLLVQPQASTTFDVGFDPVLGGSDVGNTVRLIGSINNDLHTFAVSGYGKPTLTLNAVNNYLQEGEEARFLASMDVISNDSYIFDWRITGDINENDLGFSSLIGTGFIPANTQTALLQFTTEQDGVYEGPELFNIRITDTSPGLDIGFPSVSGGVVDDDLIFIDDFDPLSVNQLLVDMAKSSIETDQIPICDVGGCEFFGRAAVMRGDGVISTLVWFEETLILMKPFGDWDGDGLPNHHDLNPFGLSQRLLDKIASYGADFEDQ